MRSSKIIMCSPKYFIHNQVNPNKNLLLLFLIHACLLCTTSWAAGSSSSPINIYKPLNHGQLVCNSFKYANCVSVSAVYDNSTLTQGNNICYNGSLISARSGKFKLGFFDRGGGTYLGVWYNGTLPEAIVWVANRDHPIPSHLQASCSLVVSPCDGNAMLLDSNNNHTYWSTNSRKVYKVNNSTTYSSPTLLRLLESGNLILMTDEGTRGTVLWRSFDNPTDTLLQGQGVTMFNATVNLTSWKPPDNPAQGFYTLTSSSNYDGLSILMIKSSEPYNYWRSSFSSLPPVLKTSFINTLFIQNSTLRLVMEASGSLKLWELNVVSKRWSILWMAPTDQCDANLAESPCGSFGVCDADNGFKCKCLPGFEPIDPDGWEYSQDFSGGCRRRTTNEGCGNVFLVLPLVKLPSSISSGNFTANSEEKCKENCLSSCKCKAYSYDSAQDYNCQIWNNDLEFIQEEYYDPSNRTLFIRVAHSDIDFGTSCKICGTNVIPYPLSISLNCGDPTYSSFQCNATNGQLYYRAPNKNLYKVSHINPPQRKFVVQLPKHDECNTTTILESKVFNLNISSSPFDVTNCSVVHLVGRQVVEVEMSWTPPACKSSADCKDWPNTSCEKEGNGKKVCMCAKGFRSNTDQSFMNCTKVLDPKETGHKGIPLWVKVGTASTCGIVLLLGSILFILRQQKRRATQRTGLIEINKENDIEDIEIPFVDFESILAATNNFSDANKLGVGGFGPVYKGNLADGNTIAVKRLSVTSVQGNEEFRNEVILIAKLQHRNLVRVLGYCIKEDEKILLYEYMPNKSLDAFLFDQTLSQLLDWSKRFNIITGIARGLLYLHQDSILRIIHRDLKPSNILLDEELNPKISDFGLARIIAGNEMATTTARVVGTHGYMSPEYALDGYFSIKSDVYGFGVIILEVISGKRCTSLCQFNDSLISLSGYAWILWDKGNPLELVDKSVNSYDSFEVKRCINVGLLCLQEDPSDRPTMSTVLLMLGGDNMNLPYPKQPIFVSRRMPPFDTTSSKYEISSNSELGTTLEGR